MICDVEGFSRFFNQPDVNGYVAKYLNHVLEAVDVCICGGSPYWLEDAQEYEPLMLQPSHVKFLGDGVMLIWTPDAKNQDFSLCFLNKLCNRLWHLKNNFNRVLSRCADTVPVFDLPPKIRFGLARGTVYKLQQRHSTRTEYIGFCINLASRLQKYCPQLGFIASARLSLPASMLEDSCYVKVVAKKIPGFSSEIVIVDKDEFERLDQATKADLFDILP